MKVILDSNVLLSALISPHSPPHLIYTALQKGRFELVSCTQQIDEIRRASRYPKLQRILQGNRVGTLINNLNRTQLVEVSRQTDIDIADPHDAFLLAMAETADADVLVTGDRRAGLLQIGSHGRTRIMAPANFCGEILQISDPEKRD